MYVLKIAIVWNQECMECKIIIPLFILGIFKIESKTSLISTGQNIFSILGCD